MNKTKDLVPKIMATRSDQNQKNATSSLTGLGGIRNAIPVINSPSTMRCEQLNQYLLRGVRILLLDVRDSVMYDAGHISGATCINILPRYLSQE